MTTPAVEDSSFAASPSAHRLARRRWGWIAIVLWLVVAAASAVGASRLNSVEDNQTVNYLPANAQSTQVERLLSRFPSGQSVPAVVVFVNESGLTPANEATIAQARQAIARQVPVRGPVSAPVVSADRKAAVIEVPLTSNDKPQVHAFNRLKEVVDSSKGGLTVGITGAAAFSVQADNAFTGIDGTLLLAAGSVVAVLLLVIYRSPVLWLLPLATSGLALLAAQAVVYLLARHAGLTVSGLSAGILDVLVFGAGTDYALLIMARYREELPRHEDHRVALAIAVRRAAPTVLASSSTVIASLLCLLAAQLNSNRGLGPVAAVGIAAAVVAALSLLPALLVVSGRRVFWPFIPRPGLAGGPANQGFWDRVAAWVVRRSRIVWPVTAALLLAGSAGLFAVQLGLPETAAYVGRVPSVEALHLLNRHFPVGTSSPAIIIVRADAASPAARAATETPGVDRVAVAGRADDLVQLSATLTTSQDSRATYDTIDRLRDRLAGVPGAEALVGGNSAIDLDTNRAASRDRLVVMPLILAVVALILALVLRAIVAPLLLVATVILSFGAALGVSAVVFRSLFHFAGIDQSAPLYDFLFLVALGVDYNIFLMTRVREEALRVGTAAGIRLGLARTGGVITSAGVILAATFAVLGVLPLVVLAEVGFTVAFGILLDTIAVRSVLVPALVAHIGEPIWWPHPLQRGAPREKPAASSASTS